MSVSNMSIQREKGLRNTNALVYLLMVNTMHFCRFTMSSCSTNWGCV